MIAHFIRTIEIDKSDPIDWIAGSISKLPLSTRMNTAVEDVATVEADWEIAGGVGRLRYRLDRAVGTPFAFDGLSDSMPLSVSTEKSSTVFINFDDQFDAERWRNAVVTFMVMRFLQVPLAAVMVGPQEFPFDEKFVVGLHSNPDMAWSALRECGYVSLIEAAFRPEVILQSHYF